MLGLLVAPVSWLGLKVARRHRGKNYLVSSVDTLNHLAGKYLALVRIRDNIVNMILQHHGNDLLAGLEDFNLGPTGFLRPEVVGELLSCGDCGHLVLHLGLRANSQCGRLLTLTSLHHSWLRGGGNDGGIGSGGG